MAAVSGAEAQVLYGWTSGKVGVGESRSQVVDLRDAELLSYFRKKKDKRTPMQKAKDKYGAAWAGMSLQEKKAALAAMRGEATEAKAAVPAVQPLAVQPLLEVVAGEVCEYYSNSLGAWRGSGVEGKVRCPGLEANVWLRCFAA